MACLLERDLVQSLVIIIRSEQCKQPSGRLQPNGFHWCSNRRDRGSAGPLSLKQREQDYNEKAEEGRQREAIKECEEAEKNQDKNNLSVLPTHCTAHFVAATWDPRVVRFVHFSFLELTPATSIESNPIIQSEKPILLTPVTALARSKRSWETPF